MQYFKIIEDMNFAVFSQQHNLSEPLKIAIVTHTPSDLRNDREKLNKAFPFVFLEPVLYHASYSIHISKTFSRYMTRPHYVIDGHKTIKLQQP